MKIEFKQEIPKKHFKIFWVKDRTYAHAIRANSPTLTKWKTAPDDIHRIFASRVTDDASLGEFMDDYGEVFSPADDGDDEMDRITYALEFAWELRSIFKNLDEPKSSNQKFKEFKTADALFERLREVRPFADPVLKFKVSRGKVEEVPAFGDLISFIFYLARRELAGLGKRKHCKECGELFTYRYERAVYCENHRTEKVRRKHGLVRKPNAKKTNR